MAHDFDTSGITVRDDDFYMKVLAGRLCACGAPKRVKDPFCFHCYKALPKEYKLGLACIIRYGFGEAYEVSLNYLKEIGRVPPAEE